VCLYNLECMCRLAIPYLVETNPLDEFASCCAILYPLTGMRRIAFALMAAGQSLDA
jgi:hypothetical protein